MKLDIIIPVYNEGENIVTIIKKIANEVSYNFRILICYDDEKDTTLIGMLEFMPDFLTELMETKCVTNKYTGHPCITKYVDRIREPHMRTEVQSRLSK